MHDAPEVYHKKQTTEKTVGEQGTSLDQGCERQEIKEKTWRTNINIY